MKAVSLVGGKLVELDFLHDLADHALENAACRGRLLALIVDDDLAHAEEEGVERVVGLWQPIMRHLKECRDDSISDKLRGYAWGVVTDLTNQQEDYTKLALIQLTGGDKGVQNQEVVFSLKLEE